MGGQDNVFTKIKTITQLLFVFTLVLKLILWLKNKF